MSTPYTKSRFAFDTPAQAIEAMLARLESLGVEYVVLRDATGRVLGQSLPADRPSPACDVISTACVRASRALRFDWLCFRRSAAAHARDAVHSTDTAFLRKSCRRVQCYGQSS